MLQHIEMSSDPKAVQDALSERAAFPGNFNPATGKWESVDGNKKLRTKLVFHPETKKLMAVTAQDAASNMDKALAIDMAISGFFQKFAKFGGQNLAMFSGSSKDVTK